MCSSWHSLFFFHFLQHEMLGCLNCCFRDVLSWGQLRAGHISQNSAWVSLVVSHSTSPSLPPLQTCWWALSGQWLGKKKIPYLYPLLITIKFVVAMRTSVSYDLCLQASKQPGPYTYVAVQWQAQLGLIQPPLKATEGFPKKPATTVCGTFLWWEKSLEQAKNAFIFPETTVFPPTKHPHLYSYNR